MLPSQSTVPARGARTASRARRVVLVGEARRAHGARGGTLSCQRVCGVAGAAGNTGACAAIACIRPDTTRRACNQLPREALYALLGLRQVRGGTLDVRLKCAHHSTVTL